MSCVADIGLKSQILSESAAFGGREGQVSAMSTIDKERLEGDYGDLDKAGGWSFNKNAMKLSFFHLMEFMCPDISL